ncbi:hypothetical protein LOAG_11986 [Loa loa]|uniref:Activin_recp domain-containing protein n=1 Tax=Loa loa TaxID=7209 RepID=A0A1I7VEW9_LOALO|nr:hypothetical protein LOAG_11986 [Loa loa]EFO16520.2 hypothetical protein LOAG_11986 [Loa loa]
MTTTDSNRSIKLIIQIFLLYVTILLPSTQALYCLVIKPGRGLISERCSHLSVACRVRVENDAIVWYTSKLYDRNQLACVMRNEYGTLDRSGCIKKSSGGVRCWCYGQSNCNNPQNMIKLYDAFKTGDSMLLDEVIDDIETSDTNDYDGESGMEITSIKTSTAKYVTETLQIFRMDNHKVATKDYSMLSSSNSMEFDQSNQNSLKQQNFDPKMRQTLKTTKISPLADVKLNETMEYSDIKHSRNQNERKIRHKETTGSGAKSLRKLKILHDTIALLLLLSLSFIML